MHLFCLLLGAFKRLKQCSITVIFTTTASTTIIIIVIIILSDQINIVDYRQQKNISMYKPLANQPLCNVALLSSFHILSLWNVPGVSMAIVTVLSQLWHFMT